jgi:hypothetical protein
MGATHRRFVTGSFLALVAGCNALAVSPGLAGSAPPVLPAEDARGDPPRGDAATLDAAPGVVDVAPDRPDASRTELCAGHMVVDLTGVPPDRDGVVRYRGNNAGLPAIGGVVAPCVSDRPVMAGYQVVMRYRVRTAASVRASTDVPGTDPRFDTVLIVADSCGPSPRILACHDDVAGASDPQSTATTPPLAPGAEIFIVVGGYDPPAFAGTTSTGEFALEITEQP